MADATFVLSTGRCGTQWLAEVLGARFGDRVAVAHEPLQTEYRPRKFLGSGTPDGLDAGSAAAVRAHLDGVERRLEAGPYVECGHPCWAAVPYLAGRFSGRFRVVHLTRHPVPTALSWLTHGAYQPPILPHLSEKVLLSPHDPGVAFGEYRDRWPALSPFEKCLYYWAEVNAFGLACEGRLGVPWLRVSFEELFAGDGLDRVLAFLGLPPDDAAAAARGRVVDRFRYVTGDWPELRVLDRHPRVAEVAAALGYRPDPPAEPALVRRYLFGEGA